MGIENADPVQNYLSQNLAKWLFTDQSALPGGQVSYSFVTPQTSGQYTISGEWKSVGSGGALSSGTVENTMVTVIENALQGFVEDVFEMSVEQANVSIGDVGVLTDPTGFYSITIPDTGQHLVNASKAGFLTESVLIDFSVTTEFNFTGNYSMVPVQLTDNEMLTVVSKWASNQFGDSKLLKVVHQWASTPE